MLSVFLTIVAIIFWLAVFGVPIEVILLVGGGIVLAFATWLILHTKSQEDKANKVVKAELIEIVAVYKRVTEHTGFSLGYSLRSGYNHYQYRNVIDRYDCTFKVEYEDGSTGKIECVQDDDIYKKLMLKTK